MRRTIRTFVAALPLAALLAAGASTLGCASVRSDLRSAFDDTQDRHERIHERHKRALGVD